ncbi:MAG: hypothetical protein ABEJ05_07285 [Haloglomus sp.]
MGAVGWYVVEHVGRSYEDDIGAALEACHEAATAVDGILADPEPGAYVDDFASDAVVVRVQYWVANPRDQNVFAIRSAFAREVKARPEAAGITISPPSKRDLEGRIELAGDHRGDN